MVRKEGFSLIEVVIVVVLVGILAGVFVNLFMGALESWLLIDNRKDALQDVRLVFTRITRGVSSAEEIVNCTSTDITLLFDIDGKNPDTKPLEVVRFFYNPTTEELKQTVDGEPEEGALLADRVRDFAFDPTAFPHLIGIRMQISKEGQELQLATQVSSKSW
jgi:prepilin-type N-terminal cleavage/methylation domain-containing protein